MIDVVPVNTHVLARAFDRLAQQSRPGLSLHAAYTDRPRAGLFLRARLAPAGPGASFLARRQGSPAAGITTLIGPEVDGARDGYITRFAAKDDPDAVSALMRAALRDHAARGTRQLIGPVPPDGLGYGYGLQVSGFDDGPALFCPAHPAQWAVFFEASGFTTHVEHLFYRFDRDCFSPNPYRQVAEWACRRFGLSVEPANLLDLYGLSRTLGRVTGDAAPLSAYRAALRALRPYCAPPFFLVCMMKDTPVGYLLAVPDGELAHFGPLHPFKGCGFRALRVLSLFVRPEARRLGCAVALASRLADRAAEAGIETILAGDIRSDNADSKRLAERLGGKVARVYCEYAIHM